MSSSDPPPETILDTTSSSGGVPEQLLLEAPSSDSSHPARQLQVGGSAISLYDELGPTIVSSDGTLSRIGNWKEMDEAERSRVLRVLGARNKVRLEERKKALDSEEAGQGSTAPQEGA